MRYNSDAFGVVAMAAYKPDWELFRVQLRSIQSQTHSNFLCLISADGGSEEISSFVAAELGHDHRFRVLGFDERLGFYGNFERVLNRVPPEASWVALADQDDNWYPSKLATMLPFLNDADLVSAQARVVKLPGNTVVAESTKRRNVRLGSLIAQNQVTGSLSLFRRSVLDLALPFPRLNTISQVHDHWIAVCAEASGRALVIGDIVQDYVQHEANVLGEVSGRSSVARSLQHLAALSRKYHGGTSPLAMSRTAHDLSFGWRRVIADTLRERVQAKSPGFEAGVESFESGHRWSLTVQTLLRGLKDGEIAPPCFLEFLAGAPLELLRREMPIQKVRSQLGGVPLPSSGKNRITIILPGFSKYPIGGYKVVYGYANFLADRGYEVTLLHALLLWGAKRRNKDIRRLPASLIAGLRPLHKPDWVELNPAIRSYTVPYLAPAMISKSDVLVATEVQTAKLVHAASLRQGVPASYFIQHYEDWSAEPAYIDATWKLPMQKIVIAPWLRDHMQTLGQDCVLIPNGIDPDEFPAGPQLRDRPYDISAMISDVPWKRADLVVQVLNSQVATGAKAVTFGTGERPDGLHPDVRYTRNPSKDEIRTAYQSSKIYLCASDGEGWHLPPAEAMSSGCAVVSTDIGGVRAYAENGALFSPVGDATGLIHNVERLMNDLELAQTLADRGLSDMRENSPQKAAGNFEAAITTVVRD